VGSWTFGDGSPGSSQSDEAIRGFVLPGITGVGGFEPPTTGLGTRCPIQARLHAPSNGELAGPICFRSIRLERRRQAESRARLSPEILEARPPLHRGERSGGDGRPLVPADLGEKSVEPKVHYDPKLRSELLQNVDPFERCLQGGHDGPPRQIVGGRQVATR
jgi:hypothetical protein